MSAREREGALSREEEGHRQEEEGKEEGGRKGSVQGHVNLPDNALLTQDVGQSGV